ncbi:MAG: 7-carboxy-7-deazaguanine synthase QueE [Dysgonamonadaceae bacterium]|jgi:organic radical activating enzyme|nr:7-carboxy-7-deazaguanine synthase QueE [Dysgonamonadaceae bacterium]MDD3356297.1 7-carboxy-7-deazaguanine synthase QueE [Dysgonamonadaceae bacterium]MDD3727840.1 7-carboxy-7-deazaguanine synthase QueE [Dysgonamonadaceae bacterium]MDD4246723.1 7-carboxy-7-deazaguanine synthase QueE [Dysgonamonadaceae bacterium]MDD4605462.1 7-carboxy-7-deazaguanine synthase QueE [Dysgonamonadaceae bacterium]
MKLIVNEIFYSLQGEGGRMGKPSIFIRLSKCNLRCSFCDTEFDSGDEMTLREILNEIAEYGCKWIIWTGGEPTLQLTDEVVAFFKNHGYLQAIETNGTRKVPNGIDYITCSPKQHFAKIKALIPHTQELRFPIQKGDPLPDISVLPSAENYYLSPIFDADQPIRENIDYCVQLVKENPQWSLSMQLHKLIQIP